MVRVEVQPHPAKWEGEDVRFGFIVGQSGATTGTTRNGQSWADWKAEKQQWRAEKEREREAKRAKRKEWKEGIARAKVEPKVDSSGP